MGRKVGITTHDVVATAARIADSDGLEAATLTAVADSLGIKTPSLYNHVTGVAGLKRLLAIHGSEILLEAFLRASDGKEGAEALRALAGANREFVCAHPGLYRALLPAPRPGEDDELYDAMAQPVLLVAEVLREMGVAKDDAIHLIRAIRSMLHGFLDLETEGGFGMPTAIDESFETAVDLLVGAVAASVTEHIGAGS